MKRCYFIRVFYKGSSSLLLYDIIDDRPRAEKMYRRSLLQALCRDSGLYFTLPFGKCTTLQCEHALRSAKVLLCWEAFRNHCMGPEQLLMHIRAQNQLLHRFCHRSCHRQNLGEYFHHVHGTTCIKDDKSCKQQYVVGE